MQRASAFGSTQCLLPAVTAALAAFDMQEGEAAAEPRLLSFANWWQHELGHEFYLGTNGQSYPQR